MKKILSLLLLIIPFLGISQARFTTGDILSKTIEIRPIQVTAKTAPNIPIVQLKNANLTVDTLIKALKLNLYNNSMFTGATQANLLYINSLGNNSNSVSTYLNTTSNGRVFLDTLESLTFKGDFVIDSPVYDIDFISPAQAKGEVYRIKLGPLVTQKPYVQGNYTMILRDGDYIYSNGTIWDKLIDNGRISALETSVTNLNSFTNVISSNVSNKVDIVAGKGLSTNDFTNTYKVKVDSVSLKQNLLNGGTGFVKSTGGTISYDNSTYLTSSALSPYLTSSTASSTYATQTNLALKSPINNPAFTGTIIAESGFNVIGNGGVYNSPNKFGVDFYGGNTRFSSNGTSTTIKGGYEFHTKSSDGTLDIKPFVITGDGNVGINNPTPNYTLDVNGTARVTGVLSLDDNVALKNAKSQYWADNTGINRRLLSLEGVNFYIGNIDNEIAGNSSVYFANNSHSFVTNNSEKMRIVQNGNVGIGTPTPTAKIEVSGGLLANALNSKIELARFSSIINNTSILRFYNNRYSTGTDWNSSSTRIQLSVDATDMGYIEFNPSGGAYGLGLGTQVGEVIRIQNNKNVGFGTTTPNGAIDVVSTTSPSYPFPRMTTAQVNALTGMTAGAWVFDTTTNHPKYYNGSAWVQL